MHNVSVTRELHIHAIQWRPDQFYVKTRNSEGLQTPRDGPPEGQNLLDRRDEVLIQS
jgi:hypothetical protein